MRLAIRLLTRLGVPVVETSAGAREGRYFAARKSSRGRGPALFLAAALTGRPSIRRSVKTDRNEQFSAQRKRSILGECQLLVHFLQILVHY